MVEDALVKNNRTLSKSMDELLVALAQGTMNVSSALAHVGGEIGGAVFGLAVQHFGSNTSHTLVTWSSSGQDPQRVRKVLTERMRMGGILQIDCGSDIGSPVTNSVIQIAIRSESEQRIGSVTAFVEHHELTADHCELLCELATVLSIHCSSAAYAR